MSASRSENESSAEPPPPAPPAKRPSGSYARVRPGPTRPAVPGWGRFLIALAVVQVAQPLTWGPPRVPLWCPAVGFAVVLFAWFGWRFGAAVLAASGALVLGQHVAAGLPSGGVSLLDVSWILAETTLLPLEAAAAWLLYHSWARGSLRLADPRSAMLFVLLVPGVVAFASALLHLGFAALIETPELGPGGYIRHATAFWLARALGLLVVPPPLLALLTPRLHRRGWLHPDAAGVHRPVETSTASLVPFADSTTFEPELGTVSGFADRLEVGLLAVAASAACVALTRFQGPGEWPGWQFWGIPGLLIVWAALRQGLVGGTVVASGSAAALLLARGLGYVPSSDPHFRPILQGHLLAQCSAALLVSAGASWVRRREAGYRQVISQVPVVIYSARLLRMPRGSDPPRGTDPAVAKPASDPARPQPSPRREIGPGVAEITLVSNASVDLLGVPGVQLLGDYTRWLAYIHAEDREVVLAALEQLARQDRPVACEYRLASSVPAPDSQRDASAAGKGEGAGRPSPRWLRDTLAPRRNLDSRLVGWDGVVSDITEQRALADDLRRTTNMFHALIGNLPAGVFFVHGRRGLPILVNARARQLLGQREDPAAGLEHLPRVYRLFRADGTLYPVAELPVYFALVEGRSTMRDDIVVHRPDGRRVPLVSWAAPVDLGGRDSPRAAVWVIEDLTALHQAEAARRDTEGRLRVIIESMAEGLLVHDANGRIVNANPAACAFFGTPASEMRGRTLADLPWVFSHEKGGPLAPDEHPARIALRTGRPVRHVLLGVRSPGMNEGESGSCLLARWILVNAVPLGSAGEKADPAARAGESAEARGQPSGVVTTFSDISAYVHAREAIRASEEGYRGLVESLPLMLIQCDRALRVTYINPATTALTGYTLGEIAEPTAWADTIFPEDLPVAYRLSRTALAGQTDRGEFRYRAKDGSERVTYAISQPRHQEGVIVGTTSLFLDMTRERRLERELQRAQRLEIVGRLASGVAHDFNNLLGVVLNLTDLARGHLPPDHPAHADLLRIGEASEQAAGLAAQLLALGKQRPTAVRRVDVNHVARRTLGLLEATLPASITLLAELASGELPVLADETQVQQVLMNLCLNARDAMPHGGSLRVRTSLADGRVRLVVADTGTGMSEELCKQVFEPFFSTKETGTGLGLAVVQQVVESHGGKVVLTSSPGEGASFEVTWPGVE